MENSIHEIIREAQDNYVDGSVKLGKHVTWEMHNTIEKISAYLNSTHTTGSTDSLGREKPFFNIVTAAVNIWYRATDLDRKDVNVLPTKSSDTLAAFIATIYLREWMREEGFGKFLNRWGRILSQYGSAVVKFVEQDGELVPSVIPWDRLIVDAVNFDALPRIEVLYKTPAELRKMKEYDQEVVESLISTKQESRKNLDETVKDLQDDFIQIFEVHGELPLSYLTDKESDKDIYRQQMHAVSFVGNGVKAGKTTYEDFSLYRGKEAKDPYMITHLIEEDGRTLSIGAVEYLFDAQWMQNHTMKNLKDTLDLSSKLIFQTSDVMYMGKNVLTAIETGDIMTHEKNQPLSQINNSKMDVTALMNFSGMWKELGQELTATPEAMRGITPPSGTPYSTTALLTGQAGSLFEVMTENKGLALEDMLREYILPHLKKKIKNDKSEISAILEDHDVQKIDAIFVPRDAIINYNKRGAEQALNLEFPEPFDQQQEEGAVKQSLAPLGNQRFFNPKKITGKDISWDKLFENLKWKLEVRVTNENQDKQAMLATLSSTLQTIASFAGRPMTPDERLVFNKIMNQTGTVSPVELSSVSSGDGTPQAEVEQPKLETITK